MNERLNLFYLANSRYGGWVTFTAHLKHGLGDGARIFRITKTDERKDRDFGYGVRYRNISHETAVRLIGPKLIVAADKNLRGTQIELIKQGAWLVIHDPTELRNPEFRDIVDERRTIILGKKAKEYLPQASYIPHPYKPVNSVNIVDDDWKKRYSHCVSVSRLDFDKNSHWLFEANRVLPEPRRILIRGAENRMYTRTKLMPKYPEYLQDSKRPKDDRQVFPREFSWAVNFLSTARYMTDFSLISGDGGRTQYTFMEAWDAGTIVLLHSGWILPDDDMVNDVIGMRQNCISISNWETLASFLQKDLPLGEVDKIRNNGKEKLKQHDCIKIGQQYLEVIGV